MAFDDIGFELLEHVLAAEEVKNLLTLIGKHKLGVLDGGIRRIDQLVPEVACLAKSEKTISIAKRYLGSAPQLVRAIYFDKSPGNNWFVTWHQDRTVAVSERFEEEGWRSWSIKSGVWHVQPPLAVLESMITIRLHLDPCTASNGCLKFLPGSHKYGIIKTGKVQEYIKNSSPVYCEAPIGSAIIMRPHIFHASEKASTPMPRRVLHFEYSSYNLPVGITWSA